MALVSGLAVASGLMQIAVGLGTTNGDGLPVWRKERGRASVWVGVAEIVAAALLFTAYVVTA